MSQNFWQLLSCLELLEFFGQMRETRKSGKESITHTGDSGFTMTSSELAVDSYTRVAVVSSPTDQREVKFV